jgi:hypothetical protein
MQKDSGVVACTPEIAAEALRNATVGATDEVRFAGVRLLANLAFALESRVVVFNTPGLVDAALAAATSDAAAKDIKEGWMGLLANLTYTPENAIALCLPPNLVRVALESGETIRMRKISLILIKNLAHCDINRAPLLDFPNLFEVVVKAASSGATDEIRGLGFGVIGKLARLPKNKDRIFNAPGLVETAVKAAWSGAAAEIVKSSALNFLGSLAENCPVKQIALFLTPDLVAVALRAAVSYDTWIRHAGLRLIWNISCANVPLLARLDVVDVALQAVLYRTIKDLGSSERSPMTEDINYVGLYIIYNLASYTKNKVAIFNAPGLVRTLLTLEAPARIQYMGLDILSALARAPENKVPLFKTPGLVDLAVASARAGITNEIKLKGMNILQNLALDPENKDPRFVEIATAAAEFGETDTITHSGWELLRVLGAPLPPFKDAATPRDDAVPVTHDQASVHLRGIASLMSAWMHTPSSR